MSYGWKPAVSKPANMGDNFCLASPQGSSDSWFQHVETTLGSDMPSTPCVAFDRRNSLASSQSWDAGLSVYSSDHSSSHSPCTPTHEQNQNFSPIDLCFAENEELLQDLTPIRQSHGLGNMSGYNTDNWAYPTLSKGLFNQQSNGVVPFPFYSEKMLPGNAEPMHLPNVGSMGQGYTIDQEQILHSSPSRLSSSGGSMIAPSYLSTVTPSETYSLKLDTEPGLDIDLSYMDDSSPDLARANSELMPHEHHYAETPQLSSPTKENPTARSKSTRAATTRKQRQLNDSKPQNGMKDKRLDLLKRKGYAFTISKQGTYICDVEGCKSPPFKREEHKKRHMKTTHSGEKPWKCGAPGCTKDFSRSDNRTQHYKTHVFPKRNAAVPDEHTWWNDKRDILAKIRREEAEGRI